MGKVTRTRYTADFKAKVALEAGWHAIEGETPLDLRVGSRFTGTLATGQHAALLDAIRTIIRIPAHYLTFPGRDGTSRC